MQVKHNNNKTMNKKRNFVAEDTEINSWEDIKPYLEDLKNREIQSGDELLNWWKNRSELEAFLSENLAWRYIKMSCDTENEALAEDFNFFVTEIEPKLSEYSDILDKKLVNSPHTKNLDSDKYFVALRSIKRNIELFRKENIPIFAEMQKETQEYGKITGAMTINYEGKELTLQQASNYLKDLDRSVRKTVYEQMNERRYADKEKLHELLDRLMEKRQKVAANAGYDNYRDYKFDAMQRFDYSIEDCSVFHNSVRETIVPLTREMQKIRKEKMQLDVLRPYDTAVDPDGKPPLKPFEKASELLDTSIEIFSKIKKRYGDYLRQMKEQSYLDLESRKGKAPGGFNYPLYESNMPFIFMNAAGNIRDVETLMHEGGHAIHSFLSSDLALTDFKQLPSEVAELASMSVELISLEHRHLFFDNADDFLRAKRHQLEGVLRVLPWVATVDKFQHELYLHPEYTHKQREALWLSVLDEFDSGLTDYSGYEHFKASAWQAQLHIYEVPFYYIEYGIAQLGAVSVWKNYKENPEKALQDFENALKLGYSKPIPEIYKAAGIEFNFSKAYMQELADFIQKELQKTV
jgi:oligoendopeptidase F